MRWLALVAACGSPPKCEELPTTPIKRIPAQAFVGQCGPRFAPACAGALATSHAHMSEAEGDVIAAACAEAYPSLDRSLSRADWFATALGTAFDAETRRGIGYGIEHDLAPDMLLVRVSADAIALDGVTTWPLSIDASTIVATLRAHGATRAGVQVWGRREAPAAAKAFDDALRGTSIPFVGCTEENCR